MTPRWIALTALVGLTFLPMTLALAESDIKSMAGSGFGAFETDAIKGHDEKKIQNDPVCDRSKRPKIHAVVPDVVKPGDQVEIKGINFGKKECFHGVSFSKASKSKTDYTYVSTSSIKATVPADIPAGLTFVITVTGAGSAQSKGVLVTK